MNDISNLSILDAEAVMAATPNAAARRGLEFTLTLSAPVSGDVLVDYQTRDATGKAGFDYERTSGTLVIPGGTTSATITVAGSPIASEQPDRDVTLELSNLRGAAFAGGGLTAQARGVILDPYEGDTRPSLFVSNPVLLEGNSGTREAMFDIRLSRPADEAITLSYSTSPLSATTSLDFAPVFGTLIIAPGQTTASVAVPVIGDTIAEPTEQFRLVLVAEEHTALVLGAGGLAGIGTILDDDAGGGDLPVVNVLDANVMVGSTSSLGGRRNVDFAVQLSAPASGDVTFDFRTIDGTAVATEDYLAQEGVVTIAGGQTTGTITVTAQGNGTTQPNKTFGLELSNISGAVFAGGATDLVAVGTLLDPTGPTAGLPTVRIENIVVEQPETGQELAEFVVSVPTLAGLNIRGDFEIFAGTATEGDDFVAEVGTFTIGAGSSSVAIPVTVLANQDRGDDSTVILRLSNITNAQLPRNADEGFAIAVLQATGVTREPAGLLAGVIADQNGTPLLETTVLFTPDDAGSPPLETMNGPDARFTFTLAEGISGYLDATRAYDPETDGDITARDALDVLRLAVGLAPSWGPPIAMHFVAADINQDGQVTAADALDVLRAAVGLQSANQPSWIFLDPEADLSGVNSKRSPRPIDVFSLG